MRAVHICAMFLMLAGCSEPEEPPTVRPWDCGPPDPVAVELQTSRHEMCVGSEQRLSVDVVSSCGDRSKSGATYSSSDPVVIAIEGDRAIAHAPGAAELRARVESIDSQRVLVRVVRCADTEADAGAE